MPTTENLDCKIFVETSAAYAELAHLVGETTGGSLSGPAFGLTITLPFCEIDIRRNPDRGLGALQTNAGFLHYPIVVEFYPDDVASEQPRMVELVGKILISFWKQGWEAVAACDYEAALPSRNSSLNATPASNAGKVGKDPVIIGIPSDG